jgi:hypothetical protein
MSAPPSWMHLVPPVLPDQVRGGRQLPITARSVAALLLDELPRRALAGALGANTNDAGQATAEVAVWAPALGLDHGQRLRGGVVEPQADGPAAAWLTRLPVARLSPHRTGTGRRGWPAGAGQPGH